MIVKNIIFGEDVRHELGNKLSLMGVIGDTLNIEIDKNTPNSQQVGIAMAGIITLSREASEKTAGDYEVAIAISFGAEPFAKMQAQVKLDGSISIFQLPIPKFSFAVEKSETLFVNIQIMNSGKIESAYADTLKLVLTRK